MKWIEGYPRWVQIADQLEERIRAGAYAPGERVPSVMGLVEEYQVAMTTAYKALKGLRDRGLVETFPGMGSYVKRQQHEG